jgi:hypothetical protein
MQKERCGLCWLGAISGLSVSAMLLLAADVVFAAARVPLPRPRPGTHVPPAIAMPEAPQSDPDCASRLAGTTVIERLPAIKGPGGCWADDVVRLVFIASSSAGRIKVSPPAVLRCGMAEALIHWVKEASDTAMRDFNAVITGISTATSFDCRGQNRVSTAKLSQHGLANAADVRALTFKDGKSLALTDPHASMHMRTWLHDAACQRFTTVLGPGSDGYHEDHIHLDLAHRRNGYRICQWDVRGPPE